jgi:hypothetical protein
MKLIRQLGLALVLTSVVACLRQTVATVEQGPASASSAAGNAAPPEPVPPSAFSVRNEPQWPCERATSIDVNRGESPEVFVKAAHCQIVGKPAPAEVVTEWSQKMRQHVFVRRVDVVRSLCAKHQVKCELSYSDPWAQQVELVGAPKRGGKRDVGAVFMFFFNCPGEVNCKMDWANTHALGMHDKHPLLGFGAQAAGYYSPAQAGFWRRELLDAQYAGLQFLLLNTYGPDIENGKLAPLVEALAEIENPIQVAMMDDTWSWGEPWFGPFWQQKPDMRDPEKTAKLLFDAKWKPFFKQIDPKHWYRFKGKPFIYFYNAGKLEPRNHAAAVLARMKAMFQSEFGEEPFLDVDTAFWEDREMAKVADAEFKWFTFQTPGKKSRSTRNGHVIDHAMVKWDAVGRDRPGGVANVRDHMVKDARLLRTLLDGSQDAELLVLATWNDLGEGTGIHRNYDYYADGRWLPPDHFMSLIRHSQAGHRVGP